MPTTAEPPTQTAAQAPPTTPGKAGNAGAPPPDHRGASNARAAAVSGWMSGLGEAVADPAAGGTPDTPPETPPAATPASNASPKASDKPPTTPAEKPTSGAGATPADPGKDSPPPPDPDKWPRSAKEWDQFKRIRDENYRKRDERIAVLERDLKEREERLAGYAQAVDPKEHSAVREERDKLSEALRLAAVERHPKFVAYYDGKLNSQVELAKRIVGPDKAEAISALLKLPESDYRNAKVEELMGELTPVAGNRLGSILNAVDELRAEREGEVARAREDYEKAVGKQAQETQAAQAAAKAQGQALFDKALKEAQGAEGGVALLQKREGDIEWNAGVDKRVEAARAILFGQEKPEHLVRAALAAVSFPALAEAHAALMAEKEQLKAQVDSLRAASPAVQRGAGQAPTDGQPRGTPVKPGSRPMQAAAEWMSLLNQQGQSE